MVLDLEIAWEGPFTPEAVITEFCNAGSPPEYDGEDYGLYQVYGRHILGDEDALLYVGLAIDQTFSQRFQQHREWIAQEWPVRIYLGRIYDPERHRSQDSSIWSADVHLAECVLIYKYSPHYNSASISDEPSLHGWREVRLRHNGARNRLEAMDDAPGDWR